MRAFTYAASVRTGIWKPQNDFALHPISVRAIASSPIVTCSPVAATTSSSRSLGISEIWCASPSSRFVSPDIAETTTTTSFPCSFVRATLFAHVLDLLDGADRGPAVLLDDECHRSRHPPGWKRMDRARKSSNLGRSGARDRDLPAVVARNRECNPYAIGWQQFLDLFRPLHQADAVARQELAHPDLVRLPRRPKGGRRRCA